MSTLRLNADEKAVLEHLAAVDSPRTSAEVAHGLSWPAGGTLAVLKQLAELGHVGYQPVPPGSKPATLWWLL